MVGWLRHREAASGMRFGILGALEVVDDEHHQLLIGARKLSAVLVILLLHRGEPMSAERLADALWGDVAPASAPKTIHVYISRLRRHLGASRLQTCGQGYLVSLAPEELDLEVFERLATEGRAALAAGDPLTGSARLRAALGLWRGEPLADFRYETFAQAEITRLEEARVSALEDRIEAELACGRHRQVVPELEAIVREQPGRERLRAHLMLALYRSGRHPEALDSYRAARGQLVEEVGIEPSRALRELHQAMLEQDPTLDIDAGPAAASDARTVSARLTNLPRRTRRLLGREREVSELCQLLTAGSDPVVSLTGIGGSGKTVLAMAVGAELLDWASGGVYLVSLAATRNPDAILPMIAEAVEITGDSRTPLSAVIASRLGRRSTVLILDNFEQLAHAAPLVVDLAAQAPELRVLVTSQVPLRVRGERVFALSGLARDDAIALFTDRVRARDREFAPTEDDLGAIERICALLDGTPLTIELAAARMTSLGTGELLTRIRRPLSVLTRGDRDAPARQRSLQAAIDWTYALLESDHRALFATLAVCAGPVPVAMIQAVAPPVMDEPDVPDGLASLLDFSFVRRRSDRRLGNRFLVPQALRDYALGRLNETGLEEETRRRHAEHVARVARAARLGKWGASDAQRAELLALSAEVRAAVAWARRHDPELHVRLCSALAAFWVYGGVLSEVTQEFSSARASGSGTTAERAWLATALAKCFQLARVRVDSDGLIDEALREWSAVEDEVERALGLQYLSWVIRWEARYQRAIAMADDALAVLRRTGDRRLILRGLVFLAHALADAQLVDATEAVLKEADQLAAGDPVWELAAIHGDCETCRGNELGALARYVESLTWTSTTGEFHQMSMDMSCIVVPLARLGYGAEAIEVFELLRLERERTGRPGDLPTALTWLEEAAATAEQQTDPAAAESARTRADNVPVTERAARTIELANHVVASHRSALSHEFDSPAA